MIRKPVLFLLQLMVVAFFLVIASLPIIAIYQNSFILFALTLPISGLVVANFITTVAGE